MYMVALADEESYADRVKYWDDVYGLCLSPLNLNLVPS